jgi:hypothetical protein
MQLVNKRLIVFYYPNINLSDLKLKINQGARFVVFQYCISLFFVISLRRFSKAYFVDRFNAADKYAKKYNILSLVFGWWGIPWGPVYTIKSIRLNKKGGIDVTDDIMLNIDEHSLKSCEIELKVTNQLFMKPDKWDQKAFNKALLKKFERDFNVRTLVAGVFINTEDDEDPFFTLGYKLENNNEGFIENLLEALHTQFRKYTRFEFVDLKQDNEVGELLVKQGLVLIER